MALGLSLIGLPVSFLAASAGLLFCFTREETQREYQIIETLNPPLRSGLNEWDAFKFWQWNKHSIVETVLAVAAGYAAALAIYLAFGI